MQRHHPDPASPQPTTPIRLIAPLGALAAGFGLCGAVSAQTADPSGASPAAAVAQAEASREAVLPAVKARAAAEPATGKAGVQATTTRIGKGNQELRDVPQSITVVTERLIDDRNLDTLKDALRNTAGISFQAAEGGEEDIRLRGFSLQSTGDIFIDGMRDPAFYDRDSFNWDRLEVLRGSASMLFGRGSTGGAVNQVSKQPMLMTEHEVAVTVGAGDFLRGTADLNAKTGEDAAVRLNVMANIADERGVRTDKFGLAPTYRFGIGTRDEVSVGMYHLENDNGIHYGLPYLSPGADGKGGPLWPSGGKNYYGMASDYNATRTTQGNLVHTHRFDAQSELRTAVRKARYARDLRASAVRFAPAALQPGGLAVNADTFSDDTVLNRSNGTGVQAKIMNLDTLYAQSDYSGRFKAWNLGHHVQAGVDVAHEDFENFGLDPTSPVLTKDRTTVGTPDDGTSIDESARVLLRNRTFTTRAIGAYAQDLVQLAPAWKLLAGVRFDRLEGTYHNLAIVPNPTNVCGVAVNAKVTRSDSLWSKRFGVLFQPTPYQSYHLSYGTSFNTAGDTYQFDAGNAEVDPESSRNVELGAKLDTEDGRFTTRVAIFHSTKYNERNRDAESVNACNYVLSGKRHAAGVELDLAGRLTPAWEVFASYAWIPSAKVDEASAAVTLPGETVGARPGLTPRHSGTVWTTYKLGGSWRVGGGLNARSSDKPQGSNTVVPRYVTADAMVEYAGEKLTWKLNVINLTDKHYADQLYRGHYIAGDPRTWQLTTSTRF